MAGTELPAVPLETPDLSGRTAFVTGKTSEEDDYGEDLPPNRFDLLTDVKSGGPTSPRGRSRTT